ARRAATAHHRRRRLAGQPDRDEVSAADELTVEVWRAPVPLARPVLTSAGPFDTFFHVVVVVGDGRGNEGWGYSGLAGQAEMDGTARRAVELLAARPDTLASLLGVERFEERSDDAPSNTVGKAAANGIAVAAWDLAARRMGLACADLWGRFPGTDSLDCYASGFFLDLDAAGLAGEADDYVSAGYRLVKMRTGLTVDDDVARLEVVRTRFPAPGAIAAYAYHAWDPDQALAFIGRVGDLLWVEDAAPYEVLDGIAGAPAPVAAGESHESIDALIELRERAGVDYVLLDVQRVGGPSRFLAAAHALAARGARIGSHVYTPQSAHLMACIADPLPVEVFDWSDPLFTRPPRPDAG